MRNTQTAPEVRHLMLVVRMFLSANVVPPDPLPYFTECIHSLEWRKKHYLASPAAPPHAHRPASATAHLEAPADSAPAE